MKHQMIGILTIFNIQALQFVTFQFDMWDLEGHIIFFFVYQRNKKCSRLILEKKKKTSNVPCVIFVFCLFLTFQFPNRF